MMISLHKILPLLLSPLMIAILLICLTLLTGRRRFSLIAAMVLVFFSLSPVSDVLTRWAEADTPPQPVSAMPQADGVLVLSGMLNAQRFDGEIRYDYGGAVDRLFGGIELMKAGTAPALYLTRGQLPWSIGRPEGEVLAEQAITSGISPEKIFLTPIAQNTAQEAAGLRQVFTSAKPHIILVTSAFHMPRSIQLFEHYGFQVTPYPVDFHQSGNRFSSQDFIPNTEALNRSFRMLREFMGRAYYSLKLSIG